MPASKAFDDDVLLQGDGLQVNGQSEILDGVELVSRRIALAQGTQHTEGPATLGQAKLWRADPPLRSSGFSTGPVSAIGIETYKVPGAVAAASLPLLVTLSWTQTLEIKRA
jgi:hypothetical protein